uniref:Solute carrier family 2, facilitated glucose transporter member 8-like n=1 Tax=Diabrotica virgifera virgifera TaxID=50390 RepID=A0A6P7H810_DIAVI
CMLMILSSASTLWIVVGIQMLEKITFLDIYYVNILNALLPAGIVAGTIIFSVAAELIGRKLTLLSISIPYAIAFTVFQFAKSIHVACIGRVIAGIAVGGSHVVLPIYIAEVAKPSSRGALGSMMTIGS